MCITHHALQLSIIFLRSSMMSPARSRLWQDLNTPLHLNRRQNSNTIRSCDTLPPCETKKSIRYGFSVQLLPGLLLEKHSYSVLENELDDLGSFLEGISWGRVSKLPWRPGSIR